MNAEGLFGSVTTDGVRGATGPQGAAGVRGADGVRAPLTAKRVAPKLSHDEILYLWGYAHGYEDRNVASLLKPEWWGEEPIIEQGWQDGFGDRAEHAPPVVEFDCFHLQDRPFGTVITAIPNPEYARNATSGRLTMYAVGFYSNGQSYVLTHKPNYANSDRAWETYDPDCYE